MNLATMLGHSGKARKFVPLTVVLVGIVSCQDERSVTSPARPTRPAAAITVASTTNLFPIADTYIKGDAVSHAASDSLNTYTWPDNQIANAILMKFDLSSIPQGSTISSATLNLYLRSSDGSADPTYTVTVHKIVNKNPDLAQATGSTYDGVNSWTPNTCCFQNVPMAQADIDPAADTKAIDKTSGLKQWNVTSIVQAWFGNPPTNFGLLVNSDPSKLRDRWRFFWSTEAAGTNLDPFLTVVYTPPPGPPGTVTDLSVVSVTNNSATLRFTEVDDGTGQPAKYNVRYAVAPIAWGSADDVSQGTCSVPMAGTAIGAQRTCTVLGLSGSTTYDFQLVAFRGTLNVDAVFGGLSNIARGTTGSPPPPPPPPSSGVVFQSDWGTALGDSKREILDSAAPIRPWSWHADFGGGQLMSVVTGGPGGRNALKVLQRGSTYAANVQVDNVVPAATDFYVRFYMRNDDTSPVGDHVVTVDTWGYANLTYVRKSSGTADWQLFMSMYGCGSTYPINHWSPTLRLTRGAWYRFEYFVDYGDGTHIQVHARVYNDAGTQTLGHADFRQSDYGSASWNGRSDWTLASYYAAGHSFCVNPAANENTEFPLRSFGMGNNGQQGANNTGLPWYFAAVQIRMDTWPGP